MLKNVGATFWGIFPFANILVATANRANILGNKCWQAMLARFAPPFKVQAILIQKFPTHKIYSILWYVITLAYCKQFLSILKTFDLSFFAILLRNIFQHWYKCFISFIHIENIKQIFDRFWKKSQWAWGLGYRKNIKTHPTKTIPGKEICYIDTFWIQIYQKKFVEQFYAHVIYNLYRFLFVLIVNSWKLSLFLIIECNCSRRELCCFSRER